MKIIKLNEYYKHDKLIDLWNNEYGLIFPISNELFKRNVSNAYHNGSLVVLINDEPIAFCISKIWNDEYIINGYDEIGWINLIYVHPKYRKQGIGTILLETIESEFKKLNKTTYYIGRDYLNYFPALPHDLKNSLEWFKKRGYETSYNTYDLICKNKEFLPIINQNYQFRTATVEDKDSLIEFSNNNWPGRWTKEVVDYFNNGGTGREYLLCVEDNKIVAFCKICYPDTNMILISYSHTWRSRFEALGGIGPLGVDKNYRGRHLGHDIVAFAKNTLLNANVSDMIIDWTGLLDFYRPFGFEVWKSYYYLTKKETKK